jgi:hypothetical protein
MLNELSYHLNLILVVLRCYCVGYALTRAVMPSLYILSFSLSLITTTPSWSSQNTLFIHVIKEFYHSAQWEAQSLLILSSHLRKYFHTIVQHPVACPIKVYYSYRLRNTFCVCLQQIRCRHNNFRKDHMYIAWRWFITEPKHVAVEKRLLRKDNT